MRNPCRVHHLLLIAVIALNGCFQPVATLTPSPQFRLEPPHDQIPISVTLVMSDAFTSSIFEKTLYRAHSGISYPIKLNLGSSLQRVFETGLKNRFQLVEVVTSRDKTRRRGLVFVPHLRHADALYGRGIDDPKATVEYGLDVFMPDGDLLDTVAGRGQGSYHSALYTFMSTIAAMATLNTLRGTDINYEYAKAFAAAEVAAFEDLMRNLKASPRFDTYVAVVLESQR